MLENLDDPTYDLLFSIRRSVRYHKHRRRFYEAWNTLTITVALIGGSSSVVIAVGDLWPNYLPLIPAVVTIVAIIDLAVGTSVRKAGHHGELAWRFIQLEKAVPIDISLSKEEIEKVKKERLEIEASEPSIMRLLDVMCHYEILKSYGHEKSLPKVPFLRRFMIHFFSQTSYARSLPAI